jgi:parallel beta-helix repeat protein
MAVVLVLLAGGANALAAPTVRCVPSLSIKPSCQIAYSTIGAALLAAGTGDTIIVGPGYYNESVTINAAITLLGAQAGRDARVDRHDPSRESIVDATGKGSAALYVEAQSVVIDGFTVEGAHSYGSPTPSPAGIYVGSYNYVQVLNNILQNSSAGVYLYDGGQDVVEHNLFRNNNDGGEVDSGYGIFLNGVPYVVITENEFSGNKAAAIGSINEAQDVSITSNTSENDGSFVIFINTYWTHFSNNHGKNFGHIGVLPALPGPPPIYADAAVVIGPGNLFLVISNNDLEKGEAPISNGIAFTTVFGTSTSPNANWYLNVMNNKIEGFPGNGIVAEEELVSTTPTGTIYGPGSFIVGNEVSDNGNDGILIEGASTYNSGIPLDDNEAEGNHVLDCHDASTGTGTLGTGNTWLNNTGNLSYPTGLCTPGRGHDHD